MAGPSSWARMCYEMLLISSLLLSLSPLLLRTQLRWGIRSPENIVRGVTCHETKAVQIRSQVCQCTSHCT